MAQEKEKKMKGAECGDKKSFRHDRRIAKIKQSAKNAGIIIGGYAATKVGSFLYANGFTHPVEADTGFTTSMIGAAAVAGGVAAVGYGVYKYIEDNPKTVKRFVHAYNKIKDKVEPVVENKLKPFAKKALKTLNSKTKPVRDKIAKKSKELFGKDGVDIYDPNGKYNSTFIGMDEKGQGKYVKKPARVVDSVLNNKRHQLNRDKSM